jgi:integrase/recombinase XerD
MQEASWNGLFDTRWEDAPLGREAIRLVQWLRERGYSDRSHREYAHAVVHLGRVLHEAQGEVTPRALDETVVEDFIGGHLPVCCCYHQRPGRRAGHVRCGLAHLLAMLREEGTISHPVSVEPIYHELLEGYCRFLRDARGLAETTIINYRRYVRDFLIGRGDAVSVDELAQLTEDDLLAFSRERGAVLGVTAWNHVALSLSSFWRWLDLRGHGTRHLIGAVPLRRKYRLADVPCALSWDQVQQLLAVVDRRELNGRRNYAMLLLAATYGLRSCEIRALRLDDIDWGDDEITIFSPKTGRSRKLPLTRPVGDAILDYLREERPASRHRRIFLSSQPPHGPLHSKINRWLARCFDRAGIEAPRRGAHTLRHSLAVHLLRSGETLKSIGDVLGHRSPETTFIYTKLHVEDLRTVALDPEVVS